jgi:hypothetical protein
MNPCRECIKVHGVSLCTNLGHCAFEGTDEIPSKDAKRPDNRFSSVSNSQVFKINQ